MQLRASNDQSMTDTFDATDNLGRYRSAFELALGIPFTDGNSVDRLINGVEIFPAMLKAIREARHSIDFVTFVYWGGAIAEEFAVALAEKAQQDVQVRVLLDAYGAKEMPRHCVELMEAAGVQVRWFRPLKTLRVWRSDKRTHRKVLVVDQQTGFTGGVGISEEWTGDARDPSEWRETHFRICGPAVRALYAAFFDNWSEAGPWEGPVREDRCEQDNDSGSPMQVVRSSSTVDWTDMATLIRVAFGVAEQSLCITTPYFAPDPLTEDLLVDCVDRGVDVSLLLPGKHNDQPLPQLAGGPSIERLLQRGVKIWTYDQTHIHAKLMVVDGVVSVIGSANLNHRSLGKDEECSAVVLDENLAAMLQRDFVADIGNASVLDATEWRNRGILTRLKERAARLVVEQL